VSRARESDAAALCAGSSPFDPSAANAEMWGKASALQAMHERDRASMNESVRGTTHMWGRASALQAKLATRHSEARP